MYYMPRHHHHGDFTQGDAQILISIAVFSIILIIPVIPILIKEHKKNDLDRTYRETLSYLIFDNLYVAMVFYLTSLYGLLDYYLAQ